MVKLIGVARKAKTRAPMEELEAVEITTEAGLEGDFRGRGPDLERQVTVIFEDAWARACAEVGGVHPWTVRRANLLVTGDGPREVGGRLTIGDVVLKVCEETEPCMRMEAQVAGLRAALTPEWRGGVACQVLAGGSVKPGDQVAYEPPTT